MEHVGFCSRRKIKILTEIQVFSGGACRLNVYEKIQVWVEAFYKIKILNKNN